MGKIVSLKLHKKRKARAEKDARAAENRVQFGRSKAERELTQAQNDKATKDLDTHKRED
ncbi:DUF4169 family protein [Aestuariivirga sp.]|uniref:DUF4169 family protein n=1 Tax=Aestuariivirga sp. TaxID=2650926 RepID=UPI0035B3B45B